MNFADNFKGKGTVEISLIDKNTNEVVDSFTNNNLIVKTGRNVLIQLLSGQATGNRVTKMAIGRGGTPDLGANAFRPVPPKDTDADLYEKLYVATISETDVDLTKVNPRATFTAMFDCAHINSFVNEVGLFFSDGATMFSRYTFDTVSLKSTSNLTLQVSWTIEF